MNRAIPEKKIREINELSCYLYKVTSGCKKVSIFWKL